MQDIDERYAMGYVGYARRNQLRGYTVYVQVCKDAAYYYADCTSYRSRKLNLNGDGQTLNDRYWRDILDTDEGVPCRTGRGRR